MLLASSLLTQYFYYIPKACLAAIIVMAVIAMIEVYLIKLVWRSRSKDVGGRLVP